MSQKKEQILDEKLLTLIKKIEVPKNPLAFYINSTKIEKEISEWVRDYFYRAINEFISPMNDSIDPYNIKKRYGYNNFLFKLYYYSGFTKNLSFRLNEFLSIIKYYDISFYLRCAVYLDSNIKLKLQAIMKGLEIFDEINQVCSQTSLNSLVKKYKLDAKPDIELLIINFEKYLYSQNTKTIKDTLQKIEVTIPKYPLSYQDTKVNFKKYSESDKYKSAYFHYTAIMICFANIVRNYERDNYYSLDLWSRLERKYNNFKKYNFVKEIITEKNKFEAWKYLYNVDKIYNYFNSKSELRKYIVTYLINFKIPQLKKFFYWEVIKNRLSENEWAMIGGTNLFYLQKIDNNITEFNMLLFFKQFKDTLIDLYNSIFWPFIKPYFYYILIFKWIKLPLKDWQKFFFLLMFFSAESYEEYVILQTIYKNIEKIWLWDFSETKNKFVYYLRRLFSLVKIFYSSIILLVLFILFLWWLGLLNIIMVWVILGLILMGALKYWLFPRRFEVLKSFTIISLSILVYVWFTTVFPKITDPRYFSYVGNEIQTLVNLDFSGAKENYNKMISFVYWKNYKNYEKQLLTFILSWTQSLKDNKSVKQIVKTTTKLTTDILDQYTTKYISLKKWQYLKFIIDREIYKLIPWIRKKDAKKLSKQVFREYLKYYCRLRRDYYCRTSLEKLPVGFKINITKIDELIKKLSTELDF